MGSLPGDMEDQRAYNASAILFDNLAAGRGDKTAIYCDLGNATYGELCDRANCFGNGFASFGLAREERIILFLDDTSQYPAAFFGAVRAGYVPILCNTLSTAELLRFYIDDSTAKVAVVDAKYQEIFASPLMSGCSVKDLIVVNGVCIENPHMNAHDGSHWIESFSDRMEPVATTTHDMAFWMYSSGSTGRPKGIVHLHKDMDYTAQTFGRHILEISEDDICFSIPKIFFAYGFGNSITFPFYVGASSVLLAGRPEPGLVYETNARYQPTLFFGLPTLYNAMLNDSSQETADMSNIRLFLSAAEVLSRDLFDSWYARFGHEIVEGLGSTEVLHIYLSNTLEAKKVSTAGRVVPGYEVKLTTPEGEAVKPGEAEILSVRGNSTAPYYWNREDKTRETMREGWIWTGDRLVEDEDGFFTFAGRVDDLIKISGQWVYPQEIELCLFDHPAVRECAVFGVEMADKRMTLKAFVVLHEDYRRGEEMTKILQDYVKNELLRYKYPRVVIYLDELPKTGSDKIDRQALLNG